MDAATWAILTVIVGGVVTGVLCTWAARRQMHEMEHRGDRFERHNERMRAIKAHCDRGPIVTLDVTSPYYRAPVDSVAATWSMSTVTISTPKPTPCAYCGRVGDGAACAGCGAPRSGT